MKKKTGEEPAQAAPRPDRPTARASTPDGSPARSSQDLRRFAFREVENLGDMEEKLEVQEGTSSLFYGSYRPTYSIV